MLSLEIKSSAFLEYFALVMHMLLQRAFSCFYDLNDYFVSFQGKYVTSRNLRDRLYRELERNLAMKVEDGETADTFIVSGRGTLHITILIENM